MAQVKLLINSLANPPLISDKYPHKNVTNHIRRVQEKQQNPDLTQHFLI